MGHENCFFFFFLKSGSPSYWPLPLKEGAWFQSLILHSKQVSEFHFLISCPFFRVSDNIPLYDILNEFQKGHSHIAVVVRDTNERKDTLKKNKEVKHRETKLNTKQRGKPETTLKQGKDLKN